MFVRIASERLNGAVELECDGLLSFAATKRELEWLRECLGHVKQNYAPPRPPGAPDEWQAEGRKLRWRIQHLEKRLHEQDKVQGDFQKATGNESKDRDPNPYKKRMLARREFNRKAKDHVKGRER